MRIFCLIIVFLFLVSCASTPGTTAKSYGLRIDSDFGQWKVLPLHDRDEAIKGAYANYFRSRRDSDPEIRWDINHKAWGRVYSRIRDCLYDLPTHTRRTVAEAVNECDRRTKL